MTDNKPCLYLLGNDRIYHALNNAGGESLERIFCDSYEEGDVVHVIEYGRYTPTKESMKTCRIPLIGVTEHCYVFQTHFSMQRTWLVVHSTFTDQSVIRMEMEKLEQAQ